MMITFTPLTFTPVATFYVYCSRCGLQQLPRISDRDSIQTTLRLRCECPPERIEESA